MKETEEFMVLVISLYASFLIIIIGIMHKVFKHLISELKKEFKESDNV
jgi:hypothetical protein